MSFLRRRNQVMRMLTRPAAGTMRSSAMRHFGQLAGVSIWLMATAAGAAETTTTTDKWQFSIAPYVWATGLNGDVGLHGRSVNVDASFTDILQDTDSIIGLEGRVEVRKGDWGGYIDRKSTRLNSSHLGISYAV